MDVEGGQGGLQSMSPFNLNQLHIMPLNAKIESILETHIGYSKPVSFS